MKKICLNMKFFDPNLIDEYNVFCQLCTVPNGDVAEKIGAPEAAKRERLLNIAFYYRTV